MQTTLATPAPNRQEDIELVTFHVGELLLGAEIRCIEEINRNVELTPVAQAPEAVRGVMNLRGEVVTVLDLRTILGLGQTEMTRNTRNIIVSAGGERTGLLVDSVADVVKAPGTEIEPVPPNISRAQARFFQGVYKLEHGLLVVLNVAEAIVTISGIN
jgi:purine-binding chemotaxis protein CheW